MLIIYRSDSIRYGNLFYSERIDGEWTALTKFPHPINSRYLESGATISANGKELYFLSNSNKLFAVFTFFLSSFDNCAKENRLDISITNNDIRSRILIYLCMFINSLQILDLLYSLIYYFHILLPLLFGGQLHFL